MSEIFNRLKRQSRSSSWSFSSLLNYYFILFAIFFFLFMGNFNAEITCSPGYYRMTVSEGDTRCFICPLGHYCPGEDPFEKIRCTGINYTDKVGLSECLECTGNYWTNNVICLECRTNEFCNGTHRTICNFGTYYNTTTKNCEPCNNEDETKYYCRNGHRYECPAGYYLSSIPNHNEKLCLECPVGSACPGEGIREICTEEKYQDQPGQTNCSICPHGYHTDGRGVYCLLCGQNDDCNGVNMTRCQAGTYYSGSVCIDCEKGFYCVDAKRFPCSPGTYSNGEKVISCKNCPKGTYLPTSRGEVEDDCIICGPGTYSDREGNAFPCTLCPKGTWSDNIKVQSESECISCPKGYFQSKEGQTSNSSCIECDMGEYSNERSGQCSKCPAGTFNNITASGECFPCEPGSYSNSPGSIECKLCEPGSYQPDANSTGCIKCARGGNSEYGAISADVCTECVPGYYQNDTTCIICPAGNFSTELSANFCTPCPPGTYLPYEGGSSESECLPCPKGSYSGIEGAASCQKCEAGTFLDEEGQTIYDCTPCGIGQYSLEGSSNCTDCSPGTYAMDEGSGFCTPCDLGYFGNSSKAEGCHPCPAGSYAEHTGSSSCTLCPPGTYNPNVTSTSSSFCIQCDKGRYSSTLSATSEFHCELCPKGTFCDEKGMSEPNKCPKGTYSTVEGSVWVYDCTPCPAGTYGPNEGADSLDECEECPLGRYNPNPGAVFLHECTYCPPGTYSQVPKATNISDCSPCPQGTFSTQATSSCVPCPLGTYNPNISSSTPSSCQICDGQSTTRSVGAKSKEECLACEPGMFLTDEYKCESCPLGKYFDKEKGFKVDSCIDCGKGYYQPNEFQTNISSCIKCPTGSYGPLEANSECIPCGKGKYSTTELSNSDTNCIECPAGTWSDLLVSNNQSNCHLCSPGTYNPYLGQSDPSSCILCPLGFKSELPGSVECIACTSNNTCFVHGSSYEIKSKDALTGEAIQIFDPKSLISVTSKDYLTLKLSIPFGLFGFFAISTWILFLFLLIIYRCQYSKLLQKFDFFFSMKHYVRIGNSQIKKPSVLGGILSMVVLIIFLGFFSSIFMDFVGNNKMILENFLLENSGSIDGEFTFYTFVSGVHQSCDAQIQITGFKTVEGKITQQCYQTNTFTSDGLEGCLCFFSCSDCSPSGNSHQITYTFNEYMMTHMIMFSIHVPHYIEGQRYVVNGSMNSGNNILTGKDLPNIFSFSLNNARYVAINDLAAFVEIFGINQEYITKGYTIQMTGKFPGSSQPNDEDFVLDEGLQIVFDIQRSFGTYVSRETIRQNFFTFLAQVLTILSMLTVLGSIILGLIERIYERLFAKKQNNIPNYSAEELEKQLAKLKEGKLEDDSDTSTKSSDDINTNEEMPRSVEPPILRIWKKQIKKRNQIVIPDSDSLMLPSIEDNKSIDDSKSDVSGNSGGVSDKEKPRTLNRFRYDPSALLQDMNSDGKTDDPKILRPETSMKLFETHPNSVNLEDETIETIETIESVEDERDPKKKGKKFDLKFDF